MSNSFSLYQELKNLGFQDNHIIILNALDSACDVRNPYPGNIFIDTSLSPTTNVYNENMEIDYIGEDVNFMTIFQLLSGRYSSLTSLSKRLQTDSNSNILVFFTGHGGNRFFKFQDYEEISSNDISFLFNEMKLKQRFNNLLFLVDTCQASTLTESIRNLTGFISLSSSKVNENSYAYLTNKDIGISVIDRFTYSLLDYLKKYRITLTTNIQNHHHHNKNKKNQDLKRNILDLYKSFQPNFLHSTPILHISNQEQKKYFEKLPLKELFTSSINGVLLEKEKESKLNKNYQNYINERAKIELDNFDSIISEL